MKSVDPIVRALAYSAFGLSLLGASGVAEGQLIAYDPFLTEADPGNPDRGLGEYSPGSDIRSQGAAALGWVGTQGVDGFGVAHAGSTSNFQPNVLGEDSPAVNYEQEGRLQWLGVGNFPFDRNLTRQLNPTPSSNDWWFSIMVNRLSWADSTDNTYAVGGFTDANGNGLQVGYDDQLSNDFLPDLVLRAGGSNIVLAADTVSSANQYVLVNLQINESGDDTINVWADPDSVAPLGAADVTLTDINVSDSLTPFTQSKYESPGQSGVVYFDEIRLGLTAEDVLGDLTSSLEADFNQDGTVDLLDLDILGSNWQMVGTPETGDANGDGTVDLLDLDILGSQWQQSASFAEALAASGIAVPEPASLVLVGAGAMLITRRRR